MAKNDPKTKHTFLRFSEHFQLNRRQVDLAFVDVPVDTDALLFVDPYAFKINNDDWYVECNNLVVDFFQCLLDAIRDKNEFRAKELLNQLSEPNRTHLGHSTGKPDGRGVGPVQSGSLFNRLRTSKAIATGMLSDLSDCELLIHGISNDKISDITTNVVNKKRFISTFSG